jgi:hypothetical protein
MKRLLLVTVLAACAVEEPEELSTESSELLQNWNAFEVESASIAGAVSRKTDATYASRAGYASFDGTGYARSFFTVTTSSYGYSANVWLRVIAPTTDSNAIDVQIDSTTTVRLEIPVTNEWTYVKVPGSWSLSASQQHSVRLTTVEPGVLVDRVLLAEGGFTPIADVYEAEYGSFVYPMQIGSQRYPFTKYAWVPNGAGQGGTVDLDVAVPVAGSYTIWGRANAPTSADNAFGIDKPGTFTLGVMWEPPLTSTSGWTWSKVPQSISLQQLDILSINRIDDGTKLDKILITNDPSFYLLESSPPMQSI